MKSNPNALSGQVSDLDLRLLRIFKSVVECGGFSAAEVELNISRSAISRYMTDLETRLHMRLCYRGRSGFALTDQGRVVYENLLQLQADLEKFRSNINSVHDRLVGELHLGMTDSTITDPHSRVPEIIARLKELGPDIEIVTQTTSPNEIERALIEGRLHVGIIPCHQSLSGLRYLPLYRERSSLFCSDRHPLFPLNDREVDPDQLARYDSASPGYKPDVNQLELQRLLKTTAHAYQMEGVATLILSGSFIGFLPDHYARQWVEKGQMRALLPQRFYFDTPFTVVWRDEAQPNQLREACLAELKRAYGLNGSE